MGRSLLNAMVNLGIESNCEEALYEVSNEKVWLGRSFTRTVACVN